MNYTILHDFKVAPVLRTILQDWSRLDPCVLITTVINIYTWTKHFPHSRPKDNPTSMFVNGLITELKFPTPAIKLPDRPDYNSLND